MQHLRARQTASFIVRIWVEYLAQTPPLWRGEMERTDTQEVKRFNTLDEMVEYLRRDVEAQIEPIRREMEG